MAVFKCGNVWRAEVFVNSKKVATKSGFRNKTEARIWHDNFKVKFDPEKVTDNKTFQFEELAEKFMATHLPTIRPGTSERYMIDIKYRIMPYFNYRPLDKITPLLIDEFRSSLQKGNLSINSINKAMDVLRLMFNKGMKWGYLNRSPFTLEKLKVPKIDYTWWKDPADIEKFLTVAKGVPVYGIYLCALETGMRLGELIGLSKQDVDLERNQIRVHRQWLDKQKDYGPCKGNNVRTIPINQELGDVLRVLIEKSPHREAIFISRNGKRLGCRKVSGDQFPRLIKRAGVSSIAFHDLRHTFASHYMINGGNIWDLMQILGHADVKMTMRYAHLNPHHLKASVVNWSRNESLTNHSQDEQKS